MSWEKLREHVRFHEAQWLRGEYTIGVAGPTRAGGTTLTSAGTNFEHREEQVTYTQRTIIHPTLRCCSPGR